MMDRRLPHRIKDALEYLEEANAILDLDNVCEMLRQNHKEYERKKIGPFRQQVMQSLPPEVEKKLHLERKRALEEPKEQPYVKPKPGQEDGAKSPGSMNGSLTQMYADQGAAPREREEAERAEKTSTEERRRKKRRQVSSQGESGEEPGKKSFLEPTPSTTLDDMGGIEQILSDLRHLVVYPLTHPEVFSHLGVNTTTGVLLHGPPGCGKTMLASAIAGTTAVPYFKVAAPEIISGMSGESETKLRQLFEEAKTNAPSIIFMDEIDAITPKRDTAAREMERRIVAQLLTCMDDIAGSNVIVIGATNRPDSLDPALRRAGRFDRELTMGIPDEACRERMLRVMTKEIRVAEDLDFLALAKLTPGFVGADLTAVAKEAALVAVQRIFTDMDPAISVPFTDEQLEPLSISMNDFTTAVPRVQPSARREGFTTVPDVSWDDVGALAKLRTELELAICAPITQAALFKELNLDVPAGCLLFGPPGCGKTLLAKAVAKESNASFISIKGPELLNKYVGESERAVRQVFQRAAASSPCVIFFDELDSLAPKRSGEGNGSTERVVNQLLTELDGMQTRSQVFVIAATNRPDIIDPAMLRPGRLDRLLFVPLPDHEGRTEILKTLTRKAPVAEDVDLHALAKDLEGYSGADLAALVRETTMMALQKVWKENAEKKAKEEGDGAEAQTEAAKPNVKLTVDMWVAARKKVTPSVSAEQQLEYRAMAESMHTRWV